MRITAIRDIVSPIRSNIANAYIDFSQMTASVVAIETDLLVEGRPVTGYGFNSNGRYAQHGLLNERFIPRLRQAKPDQRGTAHGAPEIEVAVAVAYGMQIVGGRAETGDDQRVLAILQERGDGGAAVELSLHWHHHFFLPIRRCPIRTAICWSDS